MNITQGQWIVEPVTLTISAPNPKGPLADGTERARLPIAYMPGHDPDREANAKLIAAAPDLARIARRVFLADASDNNGLVNGEARLCPAFAAELRHVLKAAGVDLGSYA